MPSDKIKCWMKCNGCMERPPIAVKEDKNGRWYANHPRKPGDTRNCRFHARYNPDIDNIEDFVALVPFIEIVEGPESVTTVSEDVPEPTPVEAEPEDEGAHDDWTWE